MLPINKFQEKDSSSFITAGIMVVKDLLQVNSLPPLEGFK